MQGLRVDGVLWLPTSKVGQKLKSLCPDHHLSLRIKWNSSNGCRLECPEDFADFTLPREFNDEINYILDKIDSKDLKKIKYINLDDESVPIAEDKAHSEDNKFFVVACLMQSKIGLRLVVYAGEQERTEKTQIFVEPEIKRLAFDQKDLHPTDVFLKLEGTFDDGSIHSMKKLGE